MKKMLLLFLSIIFTLTSYSICTAIENEWGASLRLRQEIWDNVVALGTNPTAQPDRNFFRLRVQIWDKVKFDDTFSVYARLTTEPKYFIGDYKLPLDKKSPVDGQRFDQDEIVFDNLYLDIKKPGNLPVSFRIGRQDFLGPDMYGEGFLILDGTPGDGSRTFYFNAIRATLHLAKEHNIDIVYVSNPERDIFLPSIHPSYDDGRKVAYIEHKKRLTGSNERGFWIYGRHKLADFLNVEPYYIYKKEKESDFIKQESYINTFGLRGVLTIENFKFRAEAAKQYGKYENGTKRRGFGGYAFAGYEFKKCPVSPLLEVGYVYLSGDDQNTTDKDEGFNPLFSRAPQWNELIIYTLVPETSGKGGPIPGYWTNMKIFVTNLVIKPIKDMSLKLSYQHLWADEKTNITTGNYKDMFSNDGKDRGHLYGAVLSYKFTKNLDGFIQYEYFDPKSFYSNKAESAKFFRWQLQFKI
ncbi:alginate export family protein [Thermodesulfovibrio hydrogeniphilus]